MGEDRRDPICGMRGTLPRHGHWFCSQRCAARFAARPSGEASSWTRRVRDPWVWVPLSGVLLALADAVWAPAGPVSGVYRGYLVKMGLPVIAGIVIGGLIDHFVPREYIVKFLSGSRKRVILRATLLGFLASACSHGCLALAVELFRKGASVPAVVSFLLASPWASMALTLLLLSLFGLRGVLIIGAAFAIAFLTGLVFRRLDRAGRLERNPNTPATIREFALWHDLLARWRARAWTARQCREDAAGVFRGMIPLGRMVLGWIQFGLVMSSLLGGLVPHEVFQRFLGPTTGGLVVTLLAATVMEVCSEGTAPLAFEIYRHTGAFGNAFVFLMAGVVTDYTELGTLWTVIGRRTVGWLLAVTLPMVIAMGWLFNRLVGG